MLLPPPLAFGIAWLVAASPGCPAGPPPALDFRHEISQPIVLNSRNMQELKAAARPGLVPSEDFPLHSGLIEAEFLTNVRMQFGTEGFPGQLCLRVTRLEAVISYRATIYIAREYKPGGCRYLQTKTHEMRHYDTDRNLLEASLPGMKKSLERLLAGMGAKGPMGAEAAKSAQKALLKEVENSLSQSVEQLRKLRALQQAAIDTPAEYMRLSRGCGGRR